MVDINNIVFSGGSIGGLSFVGAWIALEEAYLTKHIHGISGCSIGAVIAFLISIGYTGQELKKIAHNLSYDRLSDLKILETFDNLGLDTGNKIVELLQALLHQKVSKRDLTFKEHHVITGKDLWINASCVEEDKCYYFSHKSHPDMSVINAVRMSMSLPIILAAVKHNGKTFIDGGFHDPCPSHMFTSTDTLLLRIHNGGNSNQNEFMHFMDMLADSICKRIYSDGNNRYHSINFDTGIGGMSLSVNRRTRRNLVKLGYQKTVLWIKEHYRDSEIRDSLT